VMGHIGMTPQSVHQFGGFLQQGRDEASAERILEEAIALEAAGAFAIVLEHMPDALAATITQKLSIPTIGIGAGPECDGQILVTADVLGLSEWRPKFAKAYVDLRQTIADAVKAYGDEVRSQSIRQERDKLEQ
jgi:3-methyl-2-oxobutanoate hydroxymethyltransferase